MLEEEKFDEKYREDHTEKDDEPKREKRQVSCEYTLIKESYHDVENPDQLRVLAFSTLP